MSDQYASAEPTAEPAYAGCAVRGRGSGRRPRGALEHAPSGKIRSTGTCFLLMIVTLGIYGLVWYFKTHDEMKHRQRNRWRHRRARDLRRHRDALLELNEVGHLYERAVRSLPCLR